jgi:putative PIN family toxin of toxin-antitoxin system
MLKPRVFLDSSVIISALLSARGGSFYIINIYKNDFIFQVNQYSLDEIHDILKTKFAHQPELKTKLFVLLGASEVEILSNPSKKLVKETLNYISENDSPILASALASSDFLITLDKEFFKAQITKLATTKSLQILSPKDFIETYRKNNDEKI